MPTTSDRPAPEPPIVLDFDRAGPTGGVADPTVLDRLYAHPTRASGWVRTNFVTSLDGSAVGDDGRSGSINTPADHAVFATLRAHADAVLVGAGTVRAEGYQAIDLQPWQRALRAELGLAPFPLLAVLTARLGVDPGIAGAGDRGPVLILTTGNHDGAELDRFREVGIDVATFGPSSVPARDAVAELVRRAGPRILCEGGAGLNHALLDAGLVDDVCLTVSHRVVGGPGGRTVTGDPLRPNPTFELAHLLHSDDGTLLTRWTRGG